MDNNQFKEAVYKKYNYYKNTNDTFFSTHHYKSNNIKSISTHFLMAFLSLSIIFIGGISVYAAFGGTIGGKPVSEWFGIGFSDEYYKYKVNVENKQEIVYNETKIELVSTVCDDGFTILEFDVKLSKEDKEYLKLGEPLFPEDVIEKARLEYEQCKNKLYYSPEGSSYKTMLKEKDLVNTIKIPFNEKLNEPGTLRCNILIDNERKYAKNFQTIEKISDYEYKLYQLYFLTDKEIGNKTEFTITLYANSIENIADISNYKSDNGMVTVNTPENMRSIEINGVFNVKVSKNSAIENTKIIKPINAISKYKQMTKRIEEIKITPLQIIAKVSTQINNVSLNSLSNRKNENHIGLIDYEVYDENNNIINSIEYETKRIITYENGKIEEWGTGDIGTFKDFYNATLNLTEYIIIEKHDNMQNIKIVPVEKETLVTGEKRNELQAMEININK